MDIESGVFVITGAGSGLGAATARMIVAGGGKVVLADVNQRAGQSLANELGPAACFVATDVTDEASASATFSRALDEFGVVNGLVNWHRPR